MELKGCRKIMQNNDQVSSRIINLYFFIVLFITIKITKLQKKQSALHQIVVSIYIKQYVNFELEIFTKRNPLTLLKYFKLNRYQ